MWTFIQRNNCHLLFQRTKDGDNCHFYTSLMTPLFIAKGAA